MRRASQEVHEFREIVEQVLDTQVRRIEAGLSRPVSLPGYKKEAHASGLTFVSVDARDVRPGGIGLYNEHVWGVQTGILRYLGRTGRLAVVSPESSHDMLRRRWAFDSPMGMFLSVETERILNEEETALTVDWVRSPHLNPDVLNAIASLDEDETNKVNVCMSDLDTTRQKLNEDLQKITDNERRAAIEARHIFLD